jgi:hypothetical protein
MVGLFLLDVVLALAVMIANKIRKETDAKQ